jgi:hypothetical protein
VTVVYAGGGWDRAASERRVGRLVERTRALSAEDIRSSVTRHCKYTNEPATWGGAWRVAPENIDPRDWTGVRALRQLEDDRNYQNVEELARLQSVVAEGLKRFEFGLRRQVDARPAPRAVVSDEVPEEYRKLGSSTTVPRENVSVIRGDRAAVARPVCG